MWIAVGFYRRPPPERFELMGEDRDQAIRKSRREVARCTGGSGREDLGLGGRARPAHGQPGVGCPYVCNSSACMLCTMDTAAPPMREVMACITLEKS